MKDETQSEIIRLEKMISDFEEKRVMCILQDNIFLSTHYQLQIHAMKTYLIILKEHVHSD